MKLILVRHGQTPSNVIGSLDTAAPGPGLTELGHRQAAGVPLLLTGESIDQILVSNLTRTHLTAAPLAADRALIPVQRDGIRELAAGDLEGRTDADSVAEFFSVMRAWMHGDLAVRVPGGETGEEVLARYDSVIEEVTGSGVDTAVVFSHGGVIRLWAAARARNTEKAAGGELRLDNTGVVTLTGEPGDWKCLSWRAGSVLEP